MKTLDDDMVIRCAGSVEHCSQKNHFTISVSIEISLVFMPAMKAVVEQRQQRLQLVDLYH